MVLNKGDWRNQDYHFHFDTATEGEQASLVKGWFVNRSVDDYKVRIIDKLGIITDAIEYSKFRPKLAELYPNIVNVTSSGFEINTAFFLSNNEYFIAIFKGDEELVRVLSFVNIVPLLYVHIAKTAGSTVNKVLSEWFGQGNSLIHAESKINWKDRVKQKNVKFLSGHIPYQEFNKTRELNSYKKAITFREPYSHVVSHLSWIRALSLLENKARYKAHPEYIQILSDKLASYDLSCSMQLTEVINSFTSIEYRLLDNTQTRYIRTDISKASVDEVDFINAVDSLKHFDFVGVDNDISGFLAKVAAEYSFESIEEERRENVLNDKFGLDIDKLEIKEALFPLVQYDLKLYDVVKD
jgi:hypothetical protein